MVTAMIELPPDEWSDEIEVEIVECSGCKFRGVAVHEESDVVPWIQSARATWFTASRKRKSNRSEMRSNAAPILRTGVASVRIIDRSPKHWPGEGAQGAKLGIIGSGWSRLCDLELKHDFHASRWGLTPCHL